MATLTVTVPDDELADLAAAIGDSESTTDPERIASGSVWATNQVRSVLWKYQRGAAASAAANAVPDPMPPA